MTTSDLKKKAVSRRRLELTILLKGTYFSSSSGEQLGGGVWGVNLGEKGWDFGSLDTCPGAGVNNTAVLGHGYCPRRTRGAVQLTAEICLAAGAD